jgi:hypothetical protein
MRSFPAARVFACLATLAVLPHLLGGAPRPNLGSGDPGLLVGLTAADQRVWVIATERNVETYPYFYNGQNAQFLQAANGAAMLFEQRPEWLASALFGAAEDMKHQCSTDGGVYRCFPLGPDRGLLDVGIKAGDRVVVVTWKGETPVATAMSAELLQLLGVRPGERILGEIEGRRFYWSASRPMVVVVRDLENKPVGEWKVSRLHMPDGVVRGLANPKSVAVVGDFRARGLIKTRAYDYMIVDIEGYR